MRWYSLSSQRFTHYGCGCETFVSRPGLFAKSTPNQRTILMDQRLFCDESTEPCFFPYGWTPFFRWMLDELSSFSALMSLFSRGALQVNWRSFSSSFNIFFRRRAYRAAFFPTRMEGRFSHRMHFESSFSVLINDQFFAESISSHRLFREIRLFFIDQRTFSSGVISL